MDKLYAKILCPIDFSEHCVSALKKAGQFVNLFGSQLTVAHIINNPWSDMYAEEIEKAKGEYEEIHRTKSEFPLRILPHEEALKVVIKMVHHFVETHMPGIPYETLVKDHEHTYRAVIEYAGDHEVDLIIMATHGRTGPKRLYFGSVAENVVRRAPCSVLVVRDGV